MKKRILVGAAVIVAATGSLWAILPDKALNIHQPGTTQAEPHPQPAMTERSQPGSQSRNADLEVPEVLNFSTCESFTQTYNDLRSRWLRDNYEGWDQYIENGYSLDVVTLTIEHFLNSNFAASFRVEFLRAQTELGQELREAQNELERQHPEVRGSGVKLTVTPPSHAYRNFSSMSPDERHALMEEQRPYIEEVAYFIHESELSDGDILSLLARVEDVQRAVHYHRKETLSILDHAVSKGRLGVVQALLEQGVGPFEDMYLGSSMEHALAFLYIAKNSSSLRDAAAIVELMHQHDSSARFIEQSPERVEGHFPRHYFQFDAETITNLQRDFGLDLTRIQSKQTPSISPSHQLIQRIGDELNTYLNIDDSSEQIEKQLAECTQLLTNFYQTWQPRASHTFINPLTEHFPDNPSRVEAELAEIDPGLVDIFRGRQLGGPMASFHFQPEWSEIEAALAKRNAQPAINFIVNLDATDEVKTELGIEVFSWNSGSAIDQVLRAGLVPIKPEYFLLKKYGHLSSMQRIAALEQAGLDLRGEDSWGRTVLHYAVESGNAELVNQLIAGGFPFGSRGLNQDPLHIALNPSNHRLPVKTMVPIVRDLMDFRTEVDVYHHRRLAVMQLKYPSIYQELVADFPELEVPEGTELMSIRL